MAETGGTYAYCFDADAAILILCTIDPVNVMHDTRCAMDTVGEEKPQEWGIFICCYKFAVIGLLPLIIMA